METSTIELIFIRFQTKVLISKYHLSFQKKATNIGDSVSVRFTIPDAIFKYNRYKKIINIKLFDKNSTLINCANMTVYKGENSAYLFVEEKGINIEMIFKNIQELSIEKKGRAFTKLDTIDTLSRKRLTLINYDFSTITINKQIYDIHEMLFNNSKIKYNSFQISVFSLDKNLYAVKPIQNDDPFLSMQNLKDLKASIISESEEFEKALDFKDIEQYKSTIKNIKNNKIGISKNVINNLIKMNLPMKYLEEIFSQNSWVDLDIYYHILVLNMIFYSKEKKLHDQSLIKKFLQLTKEFNAKLKENNELKIYQKIQLLINIFGILKYLKEEKEIETLNIKFFSFSEAKENSILFKVKKFYKELIPKISEESCVFYNLLCLNSGEGYHNHNPIYCFDMQNAQMVKEHLEELFPETLVFYNLNHGTLAFNNSFGGGIVINEYKIVYENFKVQNIDYIEPCLLDIADDIAMNIVLALFHEYCGHKKYHSSFPNTNEIVYSPKKYINKANEVIELKPFQKANLKEKNCDYVLTSNTNKKGDSGHFFELSFGKIHGKSFIPYLLKFNDNGKLLKKADLFYAEAGETLRKYVELKQTCKSKKMALNYDKNMSIEDEIKDMDDKAKSKVYKRSREEEDNDDLEEKGEITSFSIYGKKPKMQKDLKLQSLNSENSMSEDNDDESKNESDEKDSEDSECSNSSFKEFEAFEKRVAKKFNFTLDETIAKQIHAKFNDPDVTPQDQSDFLYLLLNYAVLE